MKKETKEKILNLPVINMFYQLILIKRAMINLNKTKPQPLIVNLLIYVYFIMIGFAFPLMSLLGPVFIALFYVFGMFTLFYISLIETIFIYGLYVYTILFAPKSLNKNMLIEYLKYSLIGIIIGILVFLIL